MLNTAVAVAFIITVSKSGPGWVLAPVAGAAAGVVLFFRGFKTLRLKRLIQNTPASKIRSASMGLVELSGMPVGPDTIPAGITGEPCFYYRAIAWELKKSGKNNQWTKVADESLVVPFFLEDETGSVLIHAQGADMDVHRNFKDEFGSSFFEGGNVPPGPVQKFLLRFGLLGKHVRLEEYCVKPESSLFVLGTLDENHLPWAAPEPHVPPSSGIVGPRLGSPHSIGPHSIELFGSSGTPSADLRATAPLTAASIKAKPAATFAAPATSSWKDISMDEVHPPRAPAPAAPPPAEATVERWPAASPFTRLGDSENIAPQQAGAHRSGAIALEEAPADASVGDVQTNSEFDRASPVAVGKGNANTPFTISCESRRELVTVLGWKSAACIWGGPALAVACIYILLLVLGM